MENYLKQQAEVEKVETGENLLTVYFKGGGTNEIEFVEEDPASTEDIDFEYEPEMVDVSLFDNLDGVQSFATNPQTASPNVPVRSSTASARTDYVFPFFWEPMSVQFGVEYQIIKFIQDDPKLYRVRSLLNTDTLCTPTAFSNGFTYRTDDKDKLKPNIIYISTHGDINSLEIGCFFENKKYQKTENYLQSCGITSSKGIEIVKKEKVGEVMGKAFYTYTCRYVMSFDSDNLAKLIDLRSGGKADLSNAIVFLSACNSMSKNSSGEIDRRLSEVFRDRGTACVYGFSREVSVGNARQICARLLEYLLKPDHKNNQYYFKSTKEAFDKVKKSGIGEVGLLIGTGEKEFRFKYPINISPPVKRNTLTRASSSDDDKMAYGCHLNYHYYSGTSIYGLVYSSRTDNPKIGDGESLYVFKRLDHEITDGEDLYFLELPQTEPKVKYYYRSFISYDGNIYYSSEVDSFMIEEEEEPEPDPDPDPDPYEGIGVEVNGVIWALYDVGEPGTFAYDNASVRYYYWGTNIPADKIDKIDLIHEFEETLNAHCNRKLTWADSKSPCPPGWGLPNVDDYKSLLAAILNPDDIATRDKAGKIKTHGRVASEAEQMVWESYPRWTSMSGYYVVERECADQINHTFITNLRWDSMRTVARPYIEWARVGSLNEWPGEWPWREPLGDRGIILYGTSAVKCIKRI
jgi:hypothetical protein